MSDHDPAGKAVHVAAVFRTFFVAAAWTAVAWVALVYLSDLALRIQSSRIAFEKECLEKTGRNCSGIPAMPLGKGTPDDTKVRDAYKTLAQIRLAKPAGGEAETKKNLTTAVKFYVDQGVLPKIHEKLPDQLMAMDDNTVKTVFGVSAQPTKKK